jgi:hypothetical protein
MLDGPLRLNIGEPEVFRRFLLGMRVYHYRAQPRGQTTYRDVYFDTPGWGLHERGYSYCFRVQLTGSGKRKYSVRLSQASSAPPHTADELTLMSKLPASLGDAIAAGAWERAVLGGVGLAAPDRLREILRELRIGEGDVAPRLVGDLTRNRFDITDKGRTWFKLDHENWTFRLFAAKEVDGTIEFQDLVLEHSPDQRGADLLRRVRTMEEFARTMYPLRVSEHSPRFRAVTALRRP